MPPPNAEITASERQLRAPSNRSYKPIPLRWPFILVQIFILSHILTGVIFLWCLSVANNPPGREGELLSRGLRNDAPDNKEMDPGRAKDNHRLQRKDGSIITVYISEEPTTGLQRTTTTYVTTITSTYEVVTTIKETPWYPTTIPSNTSSGRFSTSINTFRPTNHTTITITITPSTTKSPTESATLGPPTDTSHSEDTPTPTATPTETPTDNGTVEPTPSNSYTHVWPEYTKTIITTRTETIVSTGYIASTVRQEPPTIGFTITGVAPGIASLITLTRAPVIFTTTLHEAGKPSEIRIITTTLPSEVVMTEITPAQTTLITINTVLTLSTPGLSLLTLFTTKAASAFTSTTTPPPSTLLLTLPNGSKQTSMIKPQPITFITTESAATSPIATITLQIATRSFAGHQEPHQDMNHPQLTSLTTIIETHPPRTYTTTDKSGSKQIIITTPPPETKTSTAFISWHNDNPKTITRPSTDDANENGTIIYTPGDTNSTLTFETATYTLTPFKYFAGAFLPTLIATILSIPLSLIDINIKRLQPFHALTSSSGAQVSQSLALSFDGIKDLFLLPHRLLLQGQPAVYFSSVLTWCTWIFVPLAAEVISLQVHGNCDDVPIITGCALALEIAKGPMYALLALLGLMILLLLLLVFVLRKWETGVYSDPWSVAGIASLMGDENVRSVINKLCGMVNKKDRKMTMKGLGTRRFALGVDRNGCYGIVPSEEGCEQLIQKESEPARSEKHQTEPRQHNRSQVLTGLTYNWRIASITIHIIILALIAYYLAVNSNIPVLDQIWPGFGFRFLLASIAQVISLFWSDLFITMATTAPFILMFNNPQPSTRSILLTRPTNEFSGYYMAIKHRDMPFLRVTAWITFFSRFLPLLMSNIPYQKEQTYWSFVICSGMSIAILSVMILTLTASLLIKFPNLPVDLRTIAGMGWYVANSKNSTLLSETLAGMAELQVRERDRRVDELGWKVRYDDRVGLYIAEEGAKSGAS